jgi:hypothetical protein
MKNVFFKPWEGDNYAEGFNGKKILVLGDSHYSENDENEDFLIGNVEYFLGCKKGGPHKGYMNTYTKFTNVLLGEKADAKTTIEFWQSIVFYNYVQNIQTGHSISPTGEEYDNSHTAYIEVLEDYQPDLIIVWGWRLWQKIIKYGTEADFNIIDERKERFYFFDIKGKKIPACGIPHPSRGLTYEWTSYLQEAIQLV